MAPIEFTEPRSNSGVAIADQLGGLRLLVIEDDPGDALYLRACLEELGVRDSLVTWVTSLAEGRTAGARRPDCVLVDLGLPDASGLQAVETMVAATPDAAVVVLTGLNDMRVEPALAAGAEDYLVKADLAADLLGRCIRYAVERKRAEATARALQEAHIRAAENSRLERGLLPRLLLGADTRAGTYYRPGHGHALLGGDFFDAVELDDGSLRVVIGDVMGHGPDQAALGVHLQRPGVRSSCGLPSDRALECMHRMLQAEAPRHWFVTCCDITVAADRRSLTVRCAGHPAPLLGDATGVRYVPVDVEPPLGIGDGTFRRSATSSLAASWQLLLYTDGLLDSFRDLDDDTDIGLNHSCSAAAAAYQLGGEIQGWVLDLVNRVPRPVTDDVAVLALATSDPADSDPADGSSR